MIHIRHPRATRLGSQDDDALGRLAGEIKLEGNATLGVSDGELANGAQAKPRGIRRVGNRGQPKAREIAVDFDEEQVSRERAGLVHTTPGANAMRRGSPGRPLRVCQFAPQVFM